MNIFSKFITESKAAKIRPMAEFAESEVIIPEGDFARLYFKIHRQPFCRFWFEAIDLPNTPFDTFVGLGPTQSGKSLLCLVIPVLYHLFEFKENVIIGVPTLTIAKSKWYKDFKRIFDTNPQFAELLPTQGPGARGGFSEIMQFKHGPILRWMPAGGSDKTRAEFPSRVVAITEVDGFERSTLSKEADPIRQLIARTRHYGARRRIYMECTVTTEEGRIWQEWSWCAGQIVLQCPHCNKWITPMPPHKKGERIKHKWRESLVGWQEAKTEIQAEKNAKWLCPECSVAWSEENRYQANKNGKMLFKGQEVLGTKIKGELPETRTFSMRWSAENNFFTDASFIARGEWSAVNTSESDSPELEQSQYVWAIPVDLRVEEAAQLSDREVREKFDKSLAKEEIPKTAIAVAYGVDLGLRAGHFVGVAATPCDPASEFSEEGVMPYEIRCFDYGVFEIHSDQFGVKDAMPAALRDFRERVEGQYPEYIDQIWADARYYGEYVYEVCRDGEPDLPFFRPSFGYGSDQERQAGYHSPKKNSSGVLYVGHEYHIEKFESFGVERVEINSSFWKGRVQEGYRLPYDVHRSISLFTPSKVNGHFSFARHITSETSSRVYVEGRGFKTVWSVLRKANHYLDAHYLAIAALDFILDTDLRDRRKDYELAAAGSKELRVASRFPLRTGA